MLYRTIKRWVLFTYIEAVLMRHDLMQAQYGDACYGARIAAEEKHAREWRAKIIARGFAPIMHAGMAHDAL